MVSSWSSRYLSCEAHQGPWKPPPGSRQSHRALCTSPSQHKQVRSKLLGQQQGVPDALHGDGGLQALLVACGTPLFSRVAA